MMKNIILSFFLIVVLQGTAQVTTIPDPAFEQELIDQGIDSDGVVNGQVLTNDISNINELVLEGWEGNVALIQDLTGIEEFINLQHLSITYSQITALDLNGNINLVELDCYNNMLTSINLASNILLERIDLSNGDINGFNQVEILDFSNCPNINYIRADAVPLNRIDLKNGHNNPNMTIDVSMWMGDGPPDPNAVYNTVCIEVDDVELAQNNQFPYSEWTIYDTQAAYLFAENCALGTQSFDVNNSISIYPNPTSDMLYFSTTNGTAVEKAVLYDISGRIVKEFSTVSNSQISVAGLAKGVYVVQMFSDHATQTAKVFVE